jgi:acyl-CoA reductase-like NAD-dependent aldehyde dehydrogenase
MGRPISQGPGEVRGLVERSNYMLDIAPSALADVSLADTDKPGFRRYIKRVAVGVVFVVSPWKCVSCFRSLTRLSLPLIHTN